ncbi:MATE family multidrug resistance protein [Aestuariispira insulae]|uniref:MATE family multidrug resistance protein n=2 Tax=Aestuariispira insulae TaxID=1461337 RepID=A0A3D9HK34_9PROT|nr:MATE family multidrug resistance protein [Aestuariispira insulae]
MQERSWDREVWRLSLPIILSNLFVPLPGAVDTAVLGHLDEEVYIGAVAVSAMIFSFIYWGFGFLRMGTTGPAAQAWGAEKHQDFWLVLLRGLLLAAVFSVSLLILQNLIGLLSFSLVAASEGVETLAWDYYAIRIWGAPATLANYVIIGWFLGAQNARIPMILQVVVNLLNVALDLWFVMGLGMTVDGVAAATVIAEYCGLALGIYYILKHRASWPDVGISFCAILEMAPLKKMMLVNRDILIRTLCLVFAFAYFTAQGAQLGDTVLAANAVLMTFQSFTAFGLDGFAHATEALVGKAVGRGKAGEIRAAVRAALRLGVIMSLVVGVFYWLASAPLIGLFTDITAVAELASDYMIWLAVLPILSVWCFVYDGVFLGATRSQDLRNGMVISLIGYLAALHLLLPLIGNHGLWLALCVLMVLRGLTLWRRFPALLDNAGKPAEA